MKTCTACGKEQPLYMFRETLVKKVRSKRCKTCEMPHSGTIRTIVWGCAG